MKNSIRLLSVATLALLFASTGAQAGVYFNTSLMPEMSSDNAGSLVATDAAPTSTTGIDSRTVLGYALGGKFIIGGALNYITGSDSTETTANTTKNGNTQLDLGPTVGFTSNGFYANFAYFIVSSEVQTQTTTAPVSDVKVKHFDGSGFQASVGYSFPVAGNLRIGPSVIYRNVSYSKVQNTDNTTGTVSPEATYQTKRKNSGFQPMIMLQLAL